MRDRRRVAVPLLGHRVDDHGTAVRPRVLEGLLHGGEVVTVHRADVLHAQVLEQALRRPEVLEALLRRVQRPVHQLPREAGLLEAALEVVEGLLIAVVGAHLVQHPAAQSAQVLGDAAHGGRVRAAVVVDDDHHAPVPARGDVVDRLPGHAPRECAVADHGHHGAVPLLGLRPGPRDAVRPGERAGGVRGLHHIVLGLGAVAVAGQAPLLAERREVLASGEQLVHVRLVARVEDDRVLGRLEHAVHGQRQLDDAQVRSEVAARLGDVGDQVGADLGRQRGQLVLREGRQVRRAGDLRQQRGAGARGGQMFHGATSLLRGSAPGRDAGGGPRGRAPWIRPSRRSDGARTETCFALPGDSCTASVGSQDPCLDGTPDDATGQDQFLLGDRRYWDRLLTTVMFTRRRS